MNCEQSASSNAQLSNPVWSGYVNAQNRFGHETREEFDARAVGDAAGLRGVIRLETSSDVVEVRREHDRSRRVLANLRPHAARR
jgi:hypothetical protein